MEYEFDKVVAVSGDDHKLAALFFDKIIPYRRFIPNDYTDYERIPLSIQPEWMNGAIYRQMDSYATFKYRMTLRVYPRKGIAVQKCIKDGHSITIILDKDWVDESQKHPMTILPHSVGTGSASANTAIYFASIYLRKRHDIISVPIFTGPSNPIQFDIDHKDGLFEVVLDKLKIINSSRAGWDQILQFKADRKSVSQLRNLRLFLHDKLSDKSSSYVSDYLDRTIDLYETALRKHGFDLLESSLSTLMDSKSLIGASSLTAAALIAGLNEVALLSGLSGAILETSKVVMKVIKSRYDLKSFKDTHELAYLFEVKRLFGKKRALQKC